jgi:hypothetical protein
MNEALLDDLTSTYLDNTGSRINGVKLSALKEAEGNPLGFVNWDQLGPILGRSALIGAGGGGIVGLLRSLMSKRKQSVGDYLRNLVYGGLAGGALGGGIGFATSPRSARAYEDDDGNVQPGFKFPFGTIGEEGELPEPTNPTTIGAMDNRDMGMAWLRNSLQSYGLIETINQIKNIREGRSRIQPANISEQAAAYFKTLDKTRAAEPTKRVNAQGKPAPDGPSPREVLQQRAGISKPFLPWRRGAYYEGLGHAYRKAHPNAPAELTTLSDRNLGRKHYNSNLAGKTPRRPIVKPWAARAGAGAGIGSLLTYFLDRGEKTLR